MKAKISAKVTLRRAIWNTSARKSILNKAIAAAAEILDNRLHANIDNSTPAGRIYVKKAQTKRLTAATRVFQRKKGTKTRVVTGYEYYQASAYGQPPARRFDVLYRSLRVRRIVGALLIRAEVKAPGVTFLDSPEYLNRPFFNVIVQEFFKNEFNGLVRASVNRLTSATSEGVE